MNKKEWMFEQVCKQYLRENKHIRKLMGSDDIWPHEDLRDWSTGFKAFQSENLIRLSGHDEVYNEEIWVFEDFARDLVLLAKDYDRGIWE